jgi:NADPH-dependent curcumin reductase CurA
LRSSAFPPSRPGNCLPLLTRALLTKRIKIQGFIIFDYYGPRHSEFLGQMSAWLSEGKLVVRVAGQ